jgi:hypothetical protein
VYGLGLEMVFVVVHPSKQGRDEGREVWGNRRGREGDGGDFDKAQGGLDNLAILGGDKNDEGRDELGDDLVVDVICFTVSGENTTLSRVHSPLNSKTRRDRALMLALIICGVVPVRPAATMVMYSWALALTSPVRISACRFRLREGTPMLTIFHYIVASSPNLLDHTTLRHLVSHDDEQVESGIACLFIDLLGAENRL